MIHSQDKASSQSELEDRLVKRGQATYRQTKVKELRGSGFSASELFRTSIRAAKYFSPILLRTLLSTRSAITESVIQRSQLRLCVPPVCSGDLINPCVSTNSPLFQQHLSSCYRLASGLQRKKKKKGRRTMRAGDPWGPCLHCLPRSGMPPRTVSRGAHKHCPLHSHDDPWKTE